MKNLNIAVVNNVATYIQRDGFIVCGNSDYTVTFAFDSEWDAQLVKTARFKWNKEVRDVVIIGNIVNVPKITNATQVEIGVFAGDLYTTTPAIVPCIKSIVCGGGTPAEPSPDVYSQLIDMINAGMIQGPQGETGVSITDSEITDNGDLVIYYSNNTSENIGNIKGPTGTTPAFNIENDELYVSYDNGSSWESLGNIKGPTGTSVTVLSTTESTEDGGNNKVNFSDGKSLTVRNGRKGSDGKTPYIQDGYWYIGGNSTWVKAQGEKGEKGNKGDKGDKGDRGEKGEQGVSGAGLTPVFVDVLIEQFGTNGTQGLKYYVDPSTNVGSCLGIGSCTNTNITIASISKSYPVVDIINRAFQHNNSIERVIIPYSVGYIGTYAFSECTNLKEIIFPEQFNFFGFNVYPANITIDDHAFYGCTSLVNLEIPNSVTSIGAFAFGRCTNLTNVVLPSTINAIKEYTFFDCSNIKNITIPYKVVSIDDSAFFGCSELESITIPNTVTFIGDSVFTYCYNLKYVYYKGTKDEWNAITSLASISDDKIYYYSESQPADDGAYWHYVDGVATLWGTDRLDYTLNKDGKSYTVSGIGNITATAIAIPSAYNDLPVTSIGDRAFYKNSNITSVEIPDSVTSIGSSAFSYCGNLAKVSIGKGVESIGNYAFYNSTNLSEVNIPDSVLSIGGYAFGYTSITSLNVPDSVTSIGESVFSNCNNLTDVTIGNGLDSISNYAFSNCANLADVTLPNGINSIGNNAFSHCTNLPTINIPDSVTSIGEGAFNECRNLVSIDIPDTVTYIGAYAFQNCISLTSITIPNGITTIENETFRQCEKLVDIIMPVSVTSIGDYAFYLIDSKASIYYAGTEAQWNGIAIGNNAFRIYPTIYYNYGG